MRQPNSIAAGLVLLVLGAMALVGSWQGAGAQDDETSRGVYLPLGLHAVSMGRLPTPVVVRPTTAVPTRKPTATIDVPPTMTLEPSATPTLELGATVTGVLTVNGRPLWEGTGDGVGPGLFLQRCPASGECDVVGRTAVDGEGRYRFTVGGALGPGEYYQVAWWNSTEAVQGYELDGADLYLGRWFGPRITELAADSVVEVPAVDLGDIKLLEPTAGTGFYGFPIPFRWSTWPGGEATYRWSLCKCCQTKAQREGSFQQSVEGATYFELGEMPRGFRCDERYCWYIHVDMGADKGFGESFAVRMMWFLANPPLAAAAPLQAGPPSCAPGASR